MIPQELINNARWCVWKREIRGGKPTKVPYNPLTHKRAETNHPETFCDFEYADEAFRIYEDYNGVGVLLSNGYSAIDIDHCCGEGDISDLALSIIERMKCYTEYSPSKTGLRIIFKAPNLVYDKEKYYLKNPHNGVEIYVSGVTNRFVTITGNTLYNYPVREVNEELLSVLNDYMLRPTTTKKSDSPTKRPAVSIPDEQLLSAALRNEKFRALFEGDMSAYNNDHSSADLALCNMLAFWTGKDPEQMDRLFRRSQLYRQGKWGEREDYSRATIQKAISSCNEVYNPQKSNGIWDRLDIPPMQTGNWTVNNLGITHYATPKKDEDVAVEKHITHTPLFPAAYLENSSEGVHKVKITYLYNGVQKNLVCDRETIASKSKIVTLANYGIGVTTANASALVNFFSEMEQINGNIIPHYQSVSHLGWVGNNFLPYDDNVKFDGETNNRSLYAAISQSGDYDEWVRYTHKLRENKYLRLMMAASFASPLIERVKALPFIFHLWGSTGKGKTVALMVAMSIWGDPSAGKLTRTMNMTNAAMMDSVALLRNLPFGGDELQTIKNNDMNYDKLIMQITEGIERARMHYNKLLPTRSWNCGFLFTGEERCTNDFSGGGAQNRVLEVEADGEIVANGNAVCNFITKNYGYAGKRFIEYVAKRDFNAMYSEIFESVINDAHTTAKQAMAATMVLLGDRIACECIYKDETPLTASDIAEFMKRETEVDVAVRAYDYIVDWISINKNKFVQEPYGERWGIIDVDSAYVIVSVLKQALQDKGFSFDAVKKAWAKSGLLEMYQNKYIQRKSMDKQKPYCVKMKIPTIYQ